MPYFPIAFRVRKYPTVARNFFRDVLDLDLDDCILTDLSSLWDLPFEGSMEDCIEKTERLYGVTISDIKDGNLADIFARIAKAQGLK